jgi:large subunit ribosomal protein L17
MNSLSRKKANRTSLIRNLATSLVLYEKITTTTAKAKEVKPVVEHLIAIAKKNDLNSRRKLIGFFFDENAVKKTLEVLVPRYQKLNSGFIKTYRAGKRLGDSSELMILELRKLEIKKEGQDETKPEESSAKNPEKRVAKTRATSKTKSKTSAK